MRKFYLFTAFVLAMASVVTVSAQDMSVDEIINKANLVSYYAGDNGRSDVKMTITDSRGRERVREFRILRLSVNKGGEQKYYVYFKQPSDVKRMVYMVWKNIGKDDDRWLYMPALDLVKRVAARDKRSSFVGSHFVYEDVSGRGTEADAHELVSSDDKFYTIKNTPKDKDGLEFAYYTVKIDKSNFMPVKAEYFDDSGKLMRTIEALEIKDIGGHPTVVKSLATDLVREGKTVMEFTEVEYDVGIEDDIFTERYLRKPPAKWIR